MQRDPRSMCGCLRGTKLDQANTGIPENREMREPWDSFLEELDLLTTKLGKIEEQSRKVAAGVAETPSPSACHRIAFQIDPDDRIVLVALIAASIAYGPLAKMTSHLRATSSLASSTSRSSIVS